MEPTIHTRDVRLTDRLQQYVEKKTARLTRYIPNMAELRVDLSKQKARNADERKIAQLTLRDAKGTILRAEEHHADIYAAVDMVVDKMYRQIKRYRGKLQRSRRAVSAAEMTVLTAEEELLPFDDLPIEAEETETPRFAIARRKQFAMHPMSPEEAAEQMELLGHDFYLFFNSQENAVNLVYRRHSGDYGLLMPVLA